MIILISIVAFLIYNLIKWKLQKKQDAKDIAELSAKFSDEDLLVRAILDTCDYQGLDEKKTKKILRKKFGIDISVNKLKKIKKSIYDARSNEK
jgi:aldehyde:ferredoxin oxidoreductase